MVTRCRPARARIQTAATMMRFNAASRVQLFLRWQPRRQFPFFRKPPGRSMRPSRVFAKDYKSMSSTVTFANEFRRASSKRTDADYV